MKHMLAMMALMLAAPAAAAQTNAPDYWGELQKLCGKAYAGALASPVATDADMAGKPMVMHVASCTPNEIRIPFFVEADKSRTWFLRKTKKGVQLKHRHRHQDGSLDLSTNYGGTHVGEAKLEADGTIVLWFPADAESKRLFVAQNMAQSVPNVWEVRLKPGVSYTYRLWRPNRDFRVAFDLRETVPTPDAPWGGL